MSGRLNQEREAKLQLIRLKSCSASLAKLGFRVEQLDPTALRVDGFGLKFNFWPYSGWWSGKKLGSGRGYKNLIKKLRGLGVIE